MRARMPFAAGFAPVLALFLFLTASAGSALAGTRVSNPREANPRFDRPDSVLFAKSEFGILFGSPALFNVEAGYWPDPTYGVRAFGFYWGRGFAGIQGNLCRTMSRSRRSRSAIALVAGSLFADGDRWTYGGLAWDWNAAPLFMEAGVVAGSGEFVEFEDSHFALLFQVGLMGGGGVIGPR